MDKPFYPHNAIASIDVLATTLGLNKKHLQLLSSKVNESYTNFVISDPKGKKKDRAVLDAKHNLKRIQKRINSRIFEHVIFPSYLQGGLKASFSQRRDYVENARIHANCETLINLDVRNFYPNIKDNYVKGIYKYFFHFSDEVVDLLTNITTYRGSLPQGGCNSSYLANLVLFNSEYHIVSKLRGQGIRYSRLLDDITVSSEDKLSEEKISSIIKEVAGMLRKNNLRLNSDKTKITYRSVASSKMEVTGLWVKHKKPKVKKSERRYIRQLVYVCEQKAIDSLISVDYHAFWNKVSGLVAKINRLEHPQANDYRLRLKKILPIYSEAKCDQIIDSVNDILKTNKSKHNELSTIKRVNRLHYQLSILSRTKKTIAKNQKRKLRNHFNNIISEKFYWEEL